MVSTLEADLLYPHPGHSIVYTLYLFFPALSSEQHPPFWHN